MTIIPMDCKAVEVVPREDNLIYEKKLDGIRALVIVDPDKKIEIHHSESPNVVNFKYPALVKELEKLAPGIYDGELCVLDQNGFTDFSAMQARSQAVNRRKIQMNEAKYPVKYMVFDMLSTGGENIKTEYLIDRKKKLEQRLRLLPKDSSIKLVPFYPTPDALERLYGQIEGIVIKGMYSVYEEGKRSGAWRKKRFNQEKTVKVIGYEEYTRDGRSAGITLITDDGKRINLPGSRAQATKQILQNNSFVMVDIIYYDETPDGYRFPRVNKDWNPIVKRITDPKTKRGIEEP
jgi:ATP-dependent DNA ligase